MQKYFADYRGYCSTIGLHVNGTISIVDLYEDFYFYLCHEQSRNIKVEWLFAKFSQDYCFPTNGIWHG